jgi:hypothetical protein
VLVIMGAVLLSKGGILLGRSDFEVNSNSRRNSVCGCSVSLAGERCGSIGDAMEPVLTVSIDGLEV